MTVAVPARARSGLPLLAALHVRLFRERPEIDLMGVALIAVVCVLFGFGLMLSQAIGESLSRSGSPGTLLITTRGAADEAESFISDVTAGELRAKLSARGIDAGGSDRQLIVSAALPGEGDRQTFVSLRGIVSDAMPAEGYRIVRGRMFRPDVNEAIIGIAAAASLPVRLGEAIEVGRRRWTIVGVFGMDGDVRESEIVAGLAKVQERYGANDLVSSIRLALPPARQAEVTSLLADERTLDLEAEPERDYFTRKAASSRKVVDRLQLVVMGLVIPAALLGLLAIQRIRQVGLLRELRVLSLIGFRARTIALSLLARSLAGAAVAGLGAVALLALGLAGRSVEIDAGLQSITLFYRNDWRIDAATLALALALSAASSLVTRAS